MGGTCRDASLRRRGHRTDHRHHHRHRERRGHGQAGRRRARHRHIQVPPGRADRSHRPGWPLPAHRAASRRLHPLRPAPGIQAGRAHGPEPPRRLHPACQHRHGPRGGADGGAGGEDRRRTRGEHRVRRGRHRPVEGVPGRRPPAQPLLRAGRRRRPHRHARRLRRQLRRRDLAREQLHHRRPPRGRPGLRHPGHEPAHQLRRPARREGRLVHARVRLLLGRHHQHRDQVGRQRVPRLDLGQPDPGALHAVHSGRLAERPGGRRPAHPVQGLLPVRLRRRARRPHRQGQALVLRGLRAADELQRPHQVRPDPAALPHRLHDLRRPVGPAGQQPRPRAAHLGGRRQRPVRHEAARWHRGEPGHRAHPLLRHRQAHLAHQREQQRLRLLQHPAGQHLRRGRQQRLQQRVGLQPGRQQHQRHPELHRQVPRQAPARGGPRRLVRLLHQGEPGHQERREQPEHDRGPVAQHAGLHELRGPARRRHLRHRRLRGPELPHRRRRVHRGAEEHPLRRQRRGHRSLRPRRPAPVEGRRPDRLRHLQQRQVLHRRGVHPHHRRDHHDQRRPAPPTPTRPRSTVRSASSTRTSSVPTAPAPTTGARRSTRTATASRGA